MTQHVLQPAVLDLLQALGRQRRAKRVAAQPLEPGPVPSADGRPNVQVEPSDTTTFVVPRTAHHREHQPAQWTASPAAERGFHVCNGTNDLGSMKDVDPDLAQVSLAATYEAAVFTRGNAYERAVKHDVLAACGATVRPVTRQQLDAINADLQSRLAVNAAYRAAILPALAREALVAGMTCVDCGDRSVFDDTTPFGRAGQAPPLQRTGAPSTWRV